MQCIGYVLRPESEGTIAITSGDPDADPDIVPNYFGTPYDREVGASLCRAIRKLFPPNRSRRTSTTRPNPVLGWPTTTTKR